MTKELTPSFVERMTGDTSVEDSQCMSCKHWQEGPACVAFPQGIPIGILVNRLSHKEPQPGDHGIQWEKA
jgi:hypothetical protein